MNNTKSTLLINDYPMMFSPLLAELVGLNEAIILQQLHYWLLKAGKEYNGRLWVYNSISSWQTQFRFWSESTIKRTFKNLEKQGLILTANFNKKNFDKTKWYSINYDKLQELEKDVVYRLGHFDPTNVSNWSNEGGNLTQPIPEITTEITDNNKLYNIAENSAGFSKNLKEEEKEKNATLKDKPENLTREISAAGENEKPQNFFAAPKKEKKKGEKEQNPKLKELKKIISKIYARKYRQIVGVDYPSKDWGKLMKLAEKATDFFLQQIEKQNVSPEAVIVRIGMLVNFAFERKKTDPVWIFGKIAESYAELKAYFEDSRKFYKQIADKAVEEARQEQEELLEIAKDFLTLFKSDETTL